MELSEVQAHSDRIGRIAYLATVRADGRPHSVPIGIAWVDGQVCTFVMHPSVKVTNVRRDPRVHLHWQVSEESGNDSLIVEGIAEVIDTAEGRAQLWDKMGYELEEFEPNGPQSNNHVFLRIEPTSATLLYRFGFDGRDTWTSDDDVIDVRSDAATPADA